MGDPYPLLRDFVIANGLTRGRYSERVPASFCLRGFGAGWVACSLTRELALPCAPLCLFVGLWAFSFVAVLSVFSLRGFVMACSWCFQAQAVNPSMVLPPL